MRSPRRPLLAAVAIVLLMSQTCASEARGGSNPAAVKEQVVRSALRGQGLHSTLQKLIARDKYVDSTVATILHISRDDQASNQLLMELFDFVEGTQTQSQVGARCL